MAQKALAKNCDGCGTLTAAGGNYSDPVFSAQCGTCGKIVTIPNPDAPAGQPIPEKETVTFDLHNPDGSIGMIVVTGYGLETQVSNVTTLAAAPDVEDEPAPDAAPSEEPEPEAPPEEEPAPDAVS